jgi:hypothetical protein
MEVPELMPWNGFRVDEPTPYATACRQVAEILADDEWHARKEVVDTVAASCPELKRGSVNTLISKLLGHGDIRTDPGRPRNDQLIRLTTRWR